MWFIYTMEYYAAEKNNDIMKFAGKWMELENVILSERNGDNSTVDGMEAKKHLEINSNHSTTETFMEKPEADKTDKSMKDLVFLLSGSALLSSSFSFEDPQAHANRIYRMIKFDQGLDEDDSTLDNTSAPVTEEMQPLEGDDGISQMEEVD
ncbi:hypothetical protein STEG23_036466 [Scotinomys teguina]